MAASDRPTCSPGGPDARRHRITARDGHEARTVVELEAGRVPVNFGSLARDPDSRSPSFSTTMRARRTTRLTAEPPEIPTPATAQPSFDDDTNDTDDGTHSRRRVRVRRRDYRAPEADGRQGRRYWTARTISKEGAVTCVLGHEGSAPGSGTRRRVDGSCSSTDGGMGRPRRRQPAAWRCRNLEATITFPTHDPKGSRRVAARRLVPRLPRYRRAGGRAVRLGRG